MKNVFGSDSSVFNNHEIRYWNEKQTIFHHYSYQLGPAKLILARKTHNYPKSLRKGAECGLEDIPTLLTFLVKGT